MVVNKALQEFVKAFGQCLLKSNCQNFFDTSTSLMEIVSIKGKTLAYDIREIGIFTVVFIVCNDKKKRWKSNDCLLIRK